MLATEIHMKSEAVQVAPLLTVIGKEARDVYSTLNKSYDETKTHRCYNSSLIIASLAKMSHSGIVSILKTDISSVSPPSDCIDTDERLTLTFPPMQHTVSFETKSPIYRFN